MKGVNCYIIRFNEISGNEWLIFVSDSSEKRMLFYVLNDRDDSFYIHSKFTEGIIRHEDSYSITVVDKQGFKQTFYDIDRYEKDKNLKKEFDKDIKFRRLIEQMKKYLKTKKND